MNSDPYDKQFDTALNEVKGGHPDVDQSSFEHEVWSEIAIRDGEAPAGRSAWFATGFSLSAPALAACCVVAVAVGSLFGLTKAQAYDKEASLAVERRYVESIHPVMMSADHSGHDHR